MLKTVDKYEYVNEGAIIDELRCIICTQPLQSPVTTHCLHIFCQHCIETWLEANDSCPICRHSIETRTVFINNQSDTLLKQLDSLLVRCLACKKSNIKRADIQQHMERCFRTKSSNIFRKSWQSMKTIIKPKSNHQSRPTIRNNIFCRVPSTPQFPQNPFPTFNINQVQTAEPIVNAATGIFSTLIGHLLRGITIFFFIIILIAGVLIAVAIFLFFYWKTFRQIVCAVFILGWCIQLGKIILRNVS